MKKVSSLILWILLFLYCACTHKTTNNAIETNKDLFYLLDSLLAKEEVFIEIKETNIENLKKQRNRAKSATDLYAINQALYWEYRVYNADSALQYVNQNIQLAKQTNNYTWEATSLLDLCFIYTANGLLDEALKVISPIRTNNLPRELRSRHYGQMRTLSSRMQLYTSGNEKLSSYYAQQYALYSDSVLQTATPDEPRYWYNRAWKYKRTPQIEIVKQHLINEKEKLSPNSRNYSILAYNLASIYKDEGDMTKYLENLLYAGMADIRGANRDIGSLHAIAQYLYDHGDIDRAYRYISYCTDISIAYGSRVRIVHLSKLQNDIHQAYIERGQKLQKRLKIFLILVSILSSILVAAFLFIRQQVVKRTEAYKQVDEANRLQRDLNKQLQDVNLQLLDANYIKEEYIGYIFNLCSAYISKMEEFRKNINRKLKVGQLEDIQKLTNTSTIGTNELKEFYKSFDHIFLHLFPDFVAGFNDLLQPEGRIAIKNNELNTELRIHALIRLGITDSVKIAEFLHCSLQTVYNNRSRTVSKARIPKEDFIDAIKALGTKRE
ncbi:DUF6377 domain-containing protein [Bacteroides sp.]|uniref:DUF6377 domain-containing protein n=1 Tax=Bacteroides sp. TaxID=29523 RepID=UPI003AB6EFEB